VIPIGTWATRGSDAEAEAEVSPNAKCEVDHVCDVVFVDDLQFGIGRSIW